MALKKTTYLILLLCTYSIVLIIFRVNYTKHTFYLFLIWNLFLALIPFLITSYLSYVKNKKALYVLFPIWMFFLPNAPYIITDLVHLKHHSLMPIWFDLLLILSFAVSGMVLFFVSLHTMQDLIKNQFSEKKAWFMSFSMVFLSAFGVYLGRYLRWNTWDLIHQPQQLFYDISNRILYPMQHPKTWGITIGFGLFFWIGFLIFRSFLITESSNK